MNIVIKICTPTRQEIGWGDTCFAESLAKEFEKLGHHADVRFYTEWYDDDHQFDTCLVITGLFQYTPRPYHRNLVWCISHPEKRTPDELSAYDHVFIASEPFTDTVRRDLRVPVDFLPQAYDPQLFHPIDRRIEHDILFIGNNYYDNFRYRKIIQDILQTKFSRRFKVIGDGWKGVLPDDQILCEFAPYHDLPKIYGSARINLNDHHAMMLKYGFINNRTYDLAALGCFQISDAVEGLDKIGVPCYHNAQELDQLLSLYLEDDALLERTAKITHHLCKDYTFEIRGKRMLEIIG